MIPMRFDNLETFLIEYAIKFENMWKEKVIENGLYATDNLYNSFKIDVDVYEGKYEVEIDMASYWKYVENGRKPNSKFPPPNVILDWIKAKPIMPKSNNGITPTEKQLAYLIGRSIAKNGITAKPILKETTDALNEEFMNGVNKALQKDINVHIKQTIKNITKNDK